MITFALVSALATGVIAFSKTSDSIETIAKDNLKALLASRKSALSQYFDTIIHQVTYHAKSPLIISSLNDFNTAWDALKVDQASTLQGLYVHKNPYPRGKRSAFLTPTDNSLYTSVHINSHPLLANMIDTDSYYDLFLVNPQGELLYSVQKEDDFASNLLNGKWDSTNLADLFRRINSTPQAGKIHISDFTPYQPSDNKPASFIGTAVFDKSNRYLGAIILQLPIEPIDKIMQVTAGMGETGETYVVGPDFLMRSNSRFFKGRSILTTKVKTLSVDRALKGETGLSIIDDYRQIAVYSSFAPFTVLYCTVNKMGDVARNRQIRSTESCLQNVVISY